MQAYRGAQAEALVQRINSLREPYRRNAIAWLEHCTHIQICDLDEDLLRFLEGLSPCVRDRFMYSTRMVLDDAVRHFGREQEVANEIATGTAP